MKKIYKQWVIDNWVDELERSGIKHGCKRLVETRSIGPKWVYLRMAELPKKYRGRFSKIKRHTWDRMLERGNIITRDRNRYEWAINNEVDRLGIDRLYRSKRYKYGWRHKTFEELEQEVLAKSDKFFQEVS